jgi:Bacterial membrane protein YfhO
VRASYAGAHTAAANVATRFGFQVVPGMNPAESAAYRGFLDGRFGYTQRFPELFGIRWLALARGPGAPLPGPIVSRAGGLVLVRLEQVRPRAFLATGWTFAPSRDAALRMLGSSGPGRETGFVVLEGAGQPSQGGPDEAAPRLPAPNRPERLSITCVQEAPGYLVLLDEWAPGWDATVDGTRAAISRADGLFRAVELAPGTHEVVLRYRTPGLRLGVAISISTTLALLGIAWAARRRTSGIAPADGAPSGP